MFQYVCWGSFLSLTLLLAIALHHVKTGLFVWLFAVIVPALCSLSMIMFFNYIQHVHADAWSEHDHSRNFTGNIFNFLFFNTGYHTAHHEHSGLHWSSLPNADAKIAHSINPRLIERSPWFFFRQYVLALILPRFGTQQLGPEPLAAAALNLVTTHDEGMKPIGLCLLNLPRVFSAKTRVVASCHDSCLNPNQGCSKVDNHQPLCGWSNMDPRMSQ